MHSNRVAVAISGTGRTLANFIAQQKRYCYQIAGVISSAADCPGVAIAHKHSLPLFVGSFRKDQYAQTRESLHQWLQKEEIDWIALGGFLKMFPTFPEYASKIINIHPALLPKFGGKGMYGLKVHQAVLSAKESISGATIHFVTDQYDEGQIIAQESIAIDHCQSAEEIAQQVFSLECELYPKVLDQLIQAQPS